MDDLRKLLAAATPGPWSAEHHYIAGMVEGGRPNGEIIGNMRGSIDRYNTPARMRADAALIVAAVNALPGLLDRLASVERDAERYRHIRPMFRAFSVHIDGNHSWVATGELGRMRGPSLDAAIDAAIAARKGEG